MIDSQVMGPEALEEHLMDQGMVQLVASQMETVVMEQDQPGLQAMALEQTVGIPALVLLTDRKAQATVLVMEQVQDPGTLVVTQEAAQLVAQVLVTETVLTVGIPALVLLMAPEAQATAVTVAQGMEQVTLVAAQV